MSARRIYLDHAATSPLRKEALAAMEPYLREPVGNPSSPYREGQQARRALQRARRSVAETLGMETARVVFTGNGSEANLLALEGACRTLPADRRGVLSSPVEHPSVRDVLRRLSAEGAIELEEAPVDRAGRVDPDDVVRRIRRGTGLVSLMLANNEVGTVQPVADVARALRGRDVLLHTDATQAPGRIPLDLVSLGADLVVLSAHKFGGPRGVGILCCTRDLELRTPLSVGRQESGLRGGTEDVASCVGAARALEVAVEESSRVAPRLCEWARRTRLRLQDYPQVVFHSPSDRVLPGFLNFSIGSTAGSTWVAAFDQQGVSVSHGSACASLAALPSHVLFAMGSPEHARSAIRLTFGHTSRSQDVEEFVQRLRTIVEAV